MIFHNPLDNKISKYAGQAISPQDLLYEGIGDISECNEYLQNWMQRHPNDWFMVGDRIKIVVDPEKKYNTNIHKKNSTRRIRR